jgi:putative hydrolase of the HAD superfamily
VPFLLIDPDNTLVDRAGTFARWAAGFAPTHADAEWLVAADRDGLEGRERLAAMIAERFRVPGGTDVLAVLRGGLVENLELDDAVVSALADARAAGWLPFVITNGTVSRQERKLRRTGLDRLVGGWVISEGVGLRKPDPGIFRLAAQRAGQSLEGAWMIGDSPEADIAGARNAGLPSIWLRRDREWGIADYAPIRVADTFPQGVAGLLTDPSVSPDLS